MPSLGEVLDRAPVTPSFGTSGIRGLVEDLDDLVVYCAVRGTLRHLESVDLLGAKSGHAPIPIGGDLRPSTERMLGAAARAIADAGHAFEYVGRLPTPAIALRALAADSACIVVTGSHIPLDRNGIKIYRRDGELMKSDEGPIAAAIDAVRRDCLVAAAEASPFGADGYLRDGALPSLGAVNEAATHEYVDRYRRAFGPLALAGLRVLVFEHSAVGRDLLCAILENAGAEVCRAGRSDAFVPIDTEALAADRLATLAELARQHAPVDAVVSTDGDGDRPLVIGIEPDGGARFLRGDLLGVLVAQYLRADAAAVPVTSSPALAEWADRASIMLASTRVGSPHVIEAMRQLAARGARRVVGWEANGGFLSWSDLELAHGPLPALPTRDAALPIVAILHEAARSGRRVADLAEDLPHWHGASGLLDGVPPEVSARIVDLLGGDAELPGRRASVEQALSRPPERLTIDAVERTDGLRLTLSNGEVLHVRPSGNAPQLRIYVFARSGERATALVEEATSEPDGLLRRLEAIAST